MDLSKNTKFTFLLIIYGAYLLCGAVIFQTFETPNDVQHLKDIRKLRKMLMNTHNLTYEEFDSMVWKLFKVLKRSCLNVDECSERWDFYSSLYFAVSVVTTIG